MGSNTRQYEHSYYKRHRMEILKQRRQRYAQDPEYAERIRRLARERGKRKKKRRNTKFPPMARYYTITVDGKDRDVLMYEVGALAQRLGRGARTIQAWETKGTIPAALYRSDINRRLYTEDQVEALDAAMQKACKENAGGVKVVVLRKIFFEAWNALDSHGLKRS